MLQEVQTARSAEVRLESLAKLGKELLADLPGYEDVAIRLSSALKEVEERKRDLVESWVKSLFVRFLARLKVDKAMMSFFFKSSLLL